MLFSSRTNSSTHTAVLEVTFNTDPTQPTPLLEKKTLVLLLSNPVQSKQATVQQSLIQPGLTHTPPPPPDNRHILLYHGDSFFPQGTRGITAEPPTRKMIHCSTGCRKTSADSQQQTHDTLNAPKQMERCTGVPPPPPARSPQHKLRASFASRLPSLLQLVAWLCFVC